MPAEESWSEQRSRAAAEHLQRLHARQSAEHEKAQALLATFTVAAQAAGLSPVPLRVRSYSGRHTARTHLHGWYLRNDLKTAVATDGKFYILSAPLTLRDYICGATLTPSKPPLILGAGGRDGDALELRVALGRILPEWDRT